MAEAIDFITEVQRRTRAEFIAKYPHIFLIGGLSLVRPIGPNRTLIHDPLIEGTQQQRIERERPRRNSRPSLVLPVIKVQEAFPSMITVGRTANNDIVIPDVEVSKFHAYFTQKGARLELSDAGSRNGSFVGERKVQPKGPALEVRVGDRVRFSTVEFTVFDAGQCWDRLSSW
jgi:hypothetical protein